MRAAVSRALHHTTHRMAFGRPLIQQPLMRQVLADLALESEAAIALVLRVARAFDDGRPDPEARPSPGWRWRSPSIGLPSAARRLIYEAMECHGGNGYVEEGPMPRLYREAPLNAIWEGSGNVICLDVLRTLQKEPAALEGLDAEFKASSRLDSRLDAWVLRTREMLAALLTDPRGLEAQARRLVERLALALQAGLLLRHAPPAIAEAFCASRLGGEWGHAFGTLPPEVDGDAILSRAAGG